VSDRLIALAEAVARSIASVALSARTVIAKSPRPVSWTRASGSALLRAKASPSALSYAGGTLIT
jgi:hypothetical protein